MQTANPKSAQTIPGGNTPTPSNTVQVRRVRTKRQVLANAKAQGFGIYHDREVLPPCIGDLEPLPWGWGNAAGADLAIKILQAAALNEELGGPAPEECIDSSIRDALKHLDGERLNGVCRSSIAVGMLWAFSEVIAQSLKRGDALPLVEELRERSVHCADASDRQETERLKDKAISRRNAKVQGVAA